MKTCKSEQSFSQSVMKVFDGVRVESGTTSVGIPDIYYWNTWIELKNEKSIMKLPYKVHWRPGQQAFALKHLQQTGRCTYTFIRFSNCIALVPMIKHFVNNIITANDIKVFSNIKSLKEYVDVHCKRCT